MTSRYVMIFVFKQKPAYEVRMSDWSSDVCSSDLTAGREGPQGARTLNARIEDLLAGTRRGAGPASAASRYFHGRLLLITENSYRHRLFNGDIGICLRDDSGTLMAWFPGDEIGRSSCRERVCQYV